MAQLARSHFAGEGYLYVHLNGGEVDVSELSPEEQGLIRFVYPPTSFAGVSQHPESNLPIFPNPSRRNIQFYVTPNLADLPMTCQVVTSDGKSLLKRELSAHSVGELISIQLPEDIANGYYVFQVFISDRLYQNRIVVHK
ncbi:MAG: T9SS type A sorting domain-containing protein [Bacteroidota bacterium]